MKTSETALGYNNMRQLFETKIKSDIQSLILKKKAIEKNI
jgi:hypothetical protein